MAVPYAYEYNIRYNTFSASSIMSLGFDAPDFLALRGDYD